MVSGRRRSRWSSMALGPSIVHLSESCHFPDRPSPGTVGRPVDDGLGADGSTSGVVRDSPGKRARPTGTRIVIPEGEPAVTAPGVTRRVYKRQTDSQIDPPLPGPAPSTVDPPTSGA